MSKLNPAVLLAHPGTQYAPRLAAELHRHGMLDRFVTGIAVPDDGWLGTVERWVPPVLSRRWAARRVREVPAARLATFPRLEWNALRRVRRGEPLETVFAERNEAFQRAIPAAWLEAASHVIGFDTSSWVLAERAQAIDRPMILDQSIGHPRAKERVYAELRARFPEWAESVPMKTAGHLARERIEHELSTAIVAPSGFVRRTLATEGVAEEKIHVIPFGTDLSLFLPASALPAGPVIFLFVGSLSARKGVPVLLQAWREAKLAGRAELWLAGGGCVPPSAAAASDGVRWLGALSRAALAETMRRAHALVCPSFFEGLAQVQVEALAAGLPVIGTTASGADEIVEPGETGWVLVPGDIAALAAALGEVAGDAAGRERMRVRCVESRGHLGWAHYGKRWHGLMTGLGAGETCGHRRAEFSRR